MRLVAYFQLVIALAALAAAGCSQNPFLANSPFAGPASPAATSPPNAYAAQLQNLDQRTRQLDADNRDLQAQLAQSQQQFQVSQEQVTLLQKQLTDTANQLKQIQVVKTETEQKLAGLQASTKFKGGATITANNSQRAALPVVELPGIEVRQEGDVVRIEVPADRLFMPQSAQLQAGSDQLLREVAEAIRRNYPRQMIGIEGHTDNTPASGMVMSNHQLAASQAQAVFDQLTRSGLLPTRQLFTMSLGEFRPRFSNAHPAGRARNRRIELVVYPETVDGN